MPPTQWRTSFVLRVPNSLQSSTWCEFTAITVALPTSTMKRPRHDALSCTSIVGMPAYSTNGNAVPPPVCFHTAGSLSVTTCLSKSNSTTKRLSTS